MPSAVSVVSVVPDPLPYIPICHYERKTKPLTPLTPLTGETHRSMADAASNPTEQRLRTMAFRRLNSLAVVAATFCYPYYSTDAAPGRVGLRRARATLQWPDVWNQRVEFGEYINECRAREQTIRPLHAIFARRWSPKSTMVAIGCMSRSQSIRELEPRKPTTAKFQRPRMFEIERRKPG
jgi:hypothetical protein